MGTWGAESFANDMAMDWVADLEAANDLRVVRAALSAATSDGYLDADVGSVGLAAAEVVAALRKQPAPDLPAEVVAWVGEHAVEPDAELLREARQAVDAIEDSSQSELHDLWHEAAAEDRAEWHAAVDDLRRRLA